MKTIGHEDTEKIEKMDFLRVFGSLWSMVSNSFTYFHFP
jgi:hypothetical protein